MVQKVFEYSDSDSVLHTYTSNVYRPFVKKLIETQNVNLCNFDINEDVDVLWVALAYGSGVYDELINLVAEIRESFTIVNFLINPDINRIEEIKKFYNAITFNKVWDLATSSLEKTFPKDNLYVIAHSSGRATLFVASLAVAFTKAGKISSIGKAFEALDGMNALSVMFKTIGVGSKYALKAVGNASSGIYQLVEKPGGETLIRLIKRSDDSGYNLVIASNGVNRAIGNVDEVGNLNIINKLDDGKVLETIYDEAHHILTWAKSSNHSVVQAAAKVGFHMNTFENGIGLSRYRKSFGQGMHGNHPAYDDYVVHKLSEFKRDNPSFTSQSANQFIQKSLIPHMRELIEDASNSTFNLNEYFKQVVNPSIGTLLIN